MATREQSMQICPLTCSEPSGKVTPVESVGPVVLLCFSLKSPPRASAGRCAGFARPPPFQSLGPHRSALRGRFVLPPVVLYAHVRLCLTLSRLPAWSDDRFVDDSQDRLRWARVREQRGRVVVLRFRWDGGGGWRRLGCSPRLEGLRLPGEENTPTSGGRLFAALGPADNPVPPGSDVKSCIGRTSPIAASPSRDADVRFYIGRSPAVALISSTIGKPIQFPGKRGARVAAESLIK